MHVVHVTIHELRRDAFRATANGETGARSRNSIHSSDCTRDNRIARTDAAKHHWNVNICVNDQTTSGASQTLIPFLCAFCVCMRARAHLYVRRTHSAYKIIKSVHSEIYKSQNKECVRARKSTTCRICDRDRGGRNRNRRMDDMEDDIALVMKLCVESNSLF